MPRGSRSFWRIDPRAVVDFFTVNWALKLTALVLAFLLWTVVKAEEPERVTIENVPVTVNNRDGGWIMTSPPTPQSVSITVSGPSRELLRLAVERPDMVVPVEDVQDTIEVVSLRTVWVRLYGGTDNTRIESVRPDAVQLKFDRMQTLLIPLAANLTGSPVPGFELAGPIQIDPPAVRVSGPSRRVSSIDSLRIGAIDLSGRIGTDTLTMVLDTTGLGVLVSPSQVQVIIPIGPLSSDTLAKQRAEPGQRPRRSGA